jgi:hypothetical protein
MTMTGARTIVMAGALAVGLLTLSIPPAHADDQPYLTCLANGVPGYPEEGGQVVFKNPNDAVALGHQIQRDSQAGTNTQVIDGKLMAIGMSRLQAAVTAACANMMLPPQ